MRETDTTFQRVNVLTMCCNINLLCENITFVLMPYIVFQFFTLANATRQCKTWSFTDSGTVISAPTSQFFIRHHFTCLSSNLIYCIPCTKCGLLYIGETGSSLRIRFGEHRRSVINHDNTKPVARHFTSFTSVIYT